MARDTDDLHWALQRRLEDVFAKLGEKYGDLTGRVETKIRPTVSFDDVGGLAHAKQAHADLEAMRLLGGIAVRLLAKVVQLARVYLFE